MCRLTFFFLFLLLQVCRFFELERELFYYLQVGNVYIFSLGFTERLLQLMFKCFIFLRKYNNQDVHVDNTPYKYPVFLLFFSNYRIFSLIFFLIFLKKYNYQNVHLDNTSYKHPVFFHLFCSNYRFLIFLFYLIQIIFFFF